MEVDLERWFLLNTSTHGHYKMLAAVTDECENRGACVEGDNRERVLFNKHVRALAPYPPAHV